MRRTPPLLVRALACTLAVLGQTPGLAAAQAPTAATLHQEVHAVLDATTTQWAGMLSASGVFRNPFPADVARGHHSFVPPMLAYAVHRAGERTGDAEHVAAAERAWPQAVSAARASAFDMVGAAYAYRDLALGDERRTQLAAYMGAYGIPPNGYKCLIRPRCYGNLRLVDALAVLAITGAGIRAPDPAARLGRPAAARSAAARVVNRRVGRIVDHGLRARLRGRRIRGSYLSDPGMNPVAYHALSALMLAEAVRELGPRASRPARRATRETLEALSVLVAPDGDLSYLGRGQDQAWVPALVCGALAIGAADAAATRPARAGRYLAGARRALDRLRALHMTPQGLALVPGASTRATTNGIDPYAHTVAYNGLALFGLSLALDALAGIPGVPIRALPAEGRLQVTDSAASGLAVMARRGIWLAVHRKATADDARFDFGALALKRRTPQGWTDLLAPRPYAPLVPNSSGPSLIRRGRLLTPGGFGIRARRGVATVEGGYRRKDRWVRQVRFRWRLTRDGARMSVTGARRGDRFRMVAYTPAGTGGAKPRALVTATARWKFDRPIRVGRLPGYHSAAIENLDALEARFTAPRSGRFSVRIR